MKHLFLFFLITFSVLLRAQTSNQNLNSQLNSMKKFFLSDNYSEFSNYVYPKVYEMMGGKEKMIKLTKSSVNKMKIEGYKFMNIKFSNPSEFIKTGNELQFTITQELLMQTPKGKILGSYSLIGISVDNGKNWKFIDTSGKDKKTMLKFFPNLNSKIIIKPKTQKIVE